MLRATVGTFVCPSEALAWRMRASLGVDSLVTIPNFSAAPPEPPAPPRDNHRLLFVGRLSREKGVSCLLKAVSLVSAEHAATALTVVGDGPERPRLEHLVRALGLGDRVRFAGMVANDRLTAYYAAAGICVLPSLWMENCPVSALEALAAGRPLVGSDAGGIPELIRDGQTGYLFRRGDVSDLAAKLRTLMADGELTRAFARNSFSLFEKNFTMAGHVRKLMGLYGSTL